MIEQPDAIIVTLPVRFFQEYGVREYLLDLEDMNRDEDATWYRVMKNLPKQDVLYVYMVAFNRIHHRATFAGTFRGENLAFHRKRDKSLKEFPNCNGIIMCGPIIRAPYRIKMQGFQGFRYSKTIF
jgi:hypothetical protein